MHELPHGLVFSADIFEVAGAVVIRANGPIKLGGNAFHISSNFCQHHKPTHELHDDRGCGFWRDDLGVFVVPANFFTAVQS